MGLKAVYPPRDVYTLYMYICMSPMPPIGKLLIDSPEKPGSPNQCLSVIMFVLQNIDVYGRPTQIVLRIYSSRSEKTQNHF